MLLSSGLSLKNVHQTDFSKFLKRFFIVFSTFSSYLFCDSVLWPYAYSLKNVIAYERGRVFVLL